MAHWKALASAGAVALLAACAVAFPNSRAGEEPEVVPGGVVDSEELLDSGGEFVSPALTTVQ